MQNIRPLAARFPAPTALRRGSHLPADTFSANISTSEISLTKQNAPSRCNLSAAATPGVGAEPYSYESLKTAVVCPVRNLSEVAASRRLTFSEG